MADADINPYLYVSKDERIIQKGGNLRTLINRCYERTVRWRKYGERTWTGFGQTRRSAQEKVDMDLEDAIMPRAQMIDWPGWYCVGQQGRCPCYTSNWFCE